jgi:hypothetical protein
MMLLQVQCKRNSTLAANQTLCVSVCVSVVVVCVGERRAIQFLLQIQELHERSNAIRLVCINAHDETALEEEIELCDALLHYSEGALKELLRREVTLARVIQFLHFFHELSEVRVATERLHIYVHVHHMIT